MDAMQKAGLTPKERVCAVFQGMEVDRLPVINPTTLVTYEFMQQTGCYFPQAHVTVDKMAALAEAGHRVAGFDSMMPYLSMHLEAMALGCEVDWGSIDRLPSVTKPVLQTRQEFNMPDNFLDRKPIKSLLTAIRMLKNKYGSNVPIIGKVVGPWTLAYHLYGAENFLMDVILEPQRVIALLKELKKVPVSFAQAQYEAGADLVTWSDHVTGDLVSRRTYQDLLFPIHKQCTAQLSEIPTILHVCGHVMDRLSLFAEAGWTAFHLDSRNSIPDAMCLINGKMHLTGSINNPTALLNGRSEEIKQEVARAVQGGIRLISPECAIPTRVPNANLLEIVRTAQILTGGRHAT